MEFYRYVDSNGVEGLIAIDAVFRLTDHKRGHTKLEYVVAGEIEELIIKGDVAHHVDQLRRASQDAEDFGAGET